uniref:Hepatocyte growth factor-regulated tyrosine kinase substrate n=1 Tax=Romanomermis culicivorax TaxID=13658 RepID=A0A915HQ45_ROMCU
MVKNCGEKFHREIATKEFMEDLKHLAEESSSEKVKDKILELIQCWAHAFRSKAEYKIVVDTHNLMKLEGYTFPPLREADAMFDAESAPEWLDSNTCHRCSVEFGLLTRKHHCRNCGQVFCDKCSSRTLPLPHIGIETDVRVCETCFDVLRNKMASGTSKPSVSKNEANSSSETDLKLAKEKSLQDVDKLNEEEDLQLALAISQSEAEEKERQKQRQAFGLNSMFSTNHTNETEEKKEQPKSTGYTGTQEPTLNTNIGDSSDTDGELAKYLNRGYWEARRTDQKKGILRNSPTPSAPIAPMSDSNVAEVI